MIARRPLDSQFDLFVPYVADLPLRDQRETMERPFFSLAKRKRLKPIEYTSPNGEVFVNVFPNQEFGMATIWDADILIWAASVMNDRRKRGENDLPRTLSFHPYGRMFCNGCGRQAPIQKKLSVATKSRASLSGMITGPKSPGLAQASRRHHKTCTSSLLPVGRRRATWPPVRRLYSV